PVRRGGSGLVGGVQGALGGFPPGARAGPASFALLERARALPGLGGGGRAGVPAAAAAEHDDVVMAALCHNLSLVRLRSVSSCHCAALTRRGAGQLPSPPRSAPMPAPRRRCRPWACTRRGSSH